MQIVLLLVVLLLSCSSFANSIAEIDDFIDRSYVPAYDCPAPEVKDTIEKYLAFPNLSLKQQFELTTRKTHALICARDYTTAQTLVQSVLSNEEADRSERYYMAAIYQYGFIYDVQENDERCNYYLLAKDSVSDQFVDIKTSASLNYATNCLEEGIEAQLADMYALLEEITRSGDKAALAHAYNTIGLFYASIGHSTMAADQYLKANELAREVYTDENRLTILTSALTVLLSLNDLDRVQEVLNEFIETNKRVDTIQSNFLQYYSEARLYIRSKEYNKLAQAIDKWRTVEEHYNDSIAQGLFRWYASELCLYKQDKQCLYDFLEQEKLASKNYITYVNGSAQYLKFKVNMHLFLGQTDQARLAFEKFVERAQTIQYALQDINQAYDVNVFQQKIVNLETMLREQQSQRTVLIVSALLLLASMGVATLWVYRHKLLKHKQYDSTTGLLNNTTVLTKLSKLPAPGHKRTNALAIFDIGNFTEVNLTVGAAKGDFVIKQIANTFKQITRSSDILGLFGPGQFILCLADIEEDAAQSFFERVKEALSNTFAENGSSDQVSVDSSMSIYYGNESFHDINEILDNMLLSLSMKSQ
ncbi:MAG: diguanylate cyclase [Glaciecola sp.]